MMRNPNTDLCINDCSKIYADKIIAHKYLIPLCSMKFFEGEIGLVMVLIQISNTSLSFSWLLGRKARSMELGAREKRRDGSREGRRKFRIKDR